MSKSPWGNVDSWAAESEAAEREEAAAAAAAAAAGGDSQNFPSLREAATSKPKKKAPAKMSWQEFSTLGQEPNRAAGAGSRLTPEEMMYLPTGPRERSAEEMQSGRLGGGFSSYGSRFSGQQSGRGRDRDGDGEGSWANNRRTYGGFDDDRRGPPSRASDFDQPSRADEVDNWASTKKPFPSYDSNSTPASAAQSRYAMLGAGGGASRADGDDNWAASKRHIAPPPPPPSTRSSTFGSEFRDPRSETDRWTRGGTQRLVLDSPKSEQGTEVPVKANRPNPFGAARPREEVLAEKGLDWKKMDIEIETKKSGSRPTSSQSSRPQSSESARSDGRVLPGLVEGEVKPKVKVNPFGNAKPREVLLEEKGLDWRKIDLELEHGRVNRLETDEEKNLKKEIELLKEEARQNPGEGHIHDLLSKKEKELDLLAIELDDKARFGEKASERPGSSSSSGRVHERSHSRAGSVDEHRSGEFMDGRPRSRGRGGGGDGWYGRVDDRRRAGQQGGGGWPGDDRRAAQGARPTTEDVRSFQGAARPSDDRRFVQGGGRDGRFFGNRNMDRSSRSDDRW